MAVIQTDWAKGIRSVPAGWAAHDVKTVEYSFTIKDGSSLADGDVVELGPLPAFHQIQGGTLVSDAMGSGITADVGFLTYDSNGDPVVGTELFSGGDVATATALPLNSAYALRLPSIDDNRPLALKLSGEASASGSDAVVTLVLNIAPSGT